MIRKLSYSLFLATMLFVAAPCVCLAQSQVRGKVIDGNSGEPVAGAFVSILEGTTVLDGLLSGEDGSFTISVSKPVDNLTLKVSILGYAPATVSLTADGSPVTVRLKEQNLNLKASRIRANAIEEEGDTVRYSAGAFKERTDRTLGDLLKRLPGISVTKSGGILYKGDYINKFYIEGLDLMGANYGTLTNNLDLGAVAGVEVYKDHQPVKALTGLEHTGKAAVNVILKENAKGAWLFSGDAAAGAPEFPLFNVRTTLSRFAKKNQDFFLAKGNDIGDDIVKELAAQQYFGKTGAFLIDGSGLDSDFNSSLNPRKSIIDLPYEYWYDNTSAIASFNHLQKAGNDLQVRGSATFGAENYNQSKDYEETVRFGDGTKMTIRDNSSMADRLRTGFGKLSVEKNSRKVFLSDEITFSGQLRHNRASMTGNKGYSQEYDLTSVKVSNDLLSTFRIADRMALNFTSQSKYVRGRHSAAYVTDGFDATQSIEDSRFSSSNEVSTNLKAKWLRFRISGGTDISHVSRNTSLAGIGGLGDETDGSLSALMVKPKMSASTSFAVFGIDTRLTVPFSLAILSGNSGENQAWLETAPNLTMNRRLSDNLEAGARVSFSRSKSDPVTLLRAAVMTNYRSITTDGCLKDGKWLNSSASLRYSNRIKTFFATLAGHYSRRSSDRATSFDYTDNLTRSGTLPFRNFSASRGADLNISEYFGMKTLSAEVGFSFDRSGGQEYLQGDVCDFRMDNWNVSATLRSSALKWLHCEAKAGWNRQVDCTFGRTRTDIFNVTSLVTVHPVSKLDLSAEVFYRKFWRDGSYIDNVPLVKCGAQWNFSKFSVFAECRNLLDVRTLSEESVSTYRSVSTVTSLRGREFLVGIRMSR
jgi:hypothetical protein